MDTLSLNTGRSGFVMIDRIIRVDHTGIITARHFQNPDAQVHSAIEVMAQTGALHVRYLNDFTQHAFLLTIERYHAGCAPLEAGDYKISASLVSQSSRAFAHDLRLERESLEIAQGRFLFALRPYDRDFDRKRLESHYRKVFECLRNGT